MCIAPSLQRNIHSEPENSTCSIVLEKAMLNHVIWNDAEPRMAKILTQYLIGVVTQRIFLIVERFN